jgi:diketogulonate reductase-like aldo/keto reductase
MIKTVKLGDRDVPALGQGTWRLGEDRRAKAEETAALRDGVARGLTLIDTAEMYGDGDTERFLGEALAGLRDQVYLVSKVYPQNAGRGPIERACEGSLRRLRTDHLDLYLLHWRGSTPLAETIEGMEALKRAGKIGDWGVSNFDTADMAELAKAGGDGCVTNQILYNLARRGPEFDLLPDLQRRGVAAMAYSPIEQGGLPDLPALIQVAERHAATAFQIALAWVLRQPGLIAIPKAASAAHVAQNAGAADIALSPDDLALIDRALPPPTRKTALEML